MICEFIPFPLTRKRLPGACFFLQCSNTYFIFLFPKGISALLSGGGSGEVILPGSMASSKLWQVFVLFFCVCIIRSLFEFLQSLKCCETFIYVKIGWRSLCASSFFADSLQYSCTSLSNYSSYSVFILSSIFYESRVEYLKTCLATISSRSIKPSFMKVSFIILARALWKVRQRVLSSLMLGLGSIQQNYKL